MFRMVRAALTKDDPELAAPVLCEGYEFPLDLGRKIAQYGLVRRVYAERRRSKDEARWQCRDHSAFEVAISLKGRERHSGGWSGLVVCVECSDANPVIEGLKGQMQVLVGL